jgi:hypothetical protein
MTSKRDFTPCFQVQRLYLALIYLFREVYLVMSHDLKLGAFNHESALFALFFFKQG